ncbi:UbiD family decarboxylase [Marinococcus halophilus]|uniref:3-octaprenyl-4-hydroxybenzoate carboxy-lyase n=1 Tax=Marinococcus halophilus TaxID=1371 RepID=A0A510Y848_MARHA|nr:UbiD family decarboxylase [Marinococcus halophilus]OZT79466.1 UbiD family decarboxylase [Marinococcus halophilus]GEK59550.1 3-octaprenyl-4-hydroxybenzoate carboxy-lyase [Marinococcus halophilus]
MYQNLNECVEDLEKHGHLVRIKEEVDPYLEMASIHLRVYEQEGPAILFENVKGSPFQAVSNLFGSVERSKFIFRKNWKQVQNVIAMRNDPVQALKHPLHNMSSGLTAVKALPKKKKSVTENFREVSISDLPMIQHWPRDGGAFLTLPQVYTEDPEKPGPMNANLGMYRVQLSGNEFIPDEEVGLHYQIQRGIGVHQAKAVAKGEPLKVSIFLGGPPAHTISAVMPLPEGLSEMMFAGMLSGRRFQYSYEDGYCINHDADFVITGDIYPEDTKPEGPFGDHLGYYSLTHDFPVMKVHKVYAKDKAILPFTVVGRPPQEDTSFGAVIHEMTGEAIKQEITGVKEVHAVDAAGVHPLLLAIGSERYTPFQSVKQPAELLTIANRILGTGQLSLAKYLFITAEQERELDTHQEEDFFTYMLERINLRRDLHFQTKTTIDTLDYSGEGLNEGSKVIIAAYGDVKRTLCQRVPEGFPADSSMHSPKLVMPGVIAVEASEFFSYRQAAEEISAFAERLDEQWDVKETPMIIICDDSSFVSETMRNFLWAVFTRSNPSHDIYGVNSFYENKHWGCDSMIIDARIKPHHAPPLLPDENVERRVDDLIKRAGLRKK